MPSSAPNPAESFQAIPPSNTPLPLVLFNLLTPAQQHTRMKYSSCSRKKRPAPSFQHRLRGDLVAVQGAPLNFAELQGQVQVEMLRESLNPMNISKRNTSAWRQGAALGLGFQNAGVWHVSNCETLNTSPVHDMALFTFTSPRPGLQSCELF